MQSRVFRPGAWGAPAAPPAPRPAKPRGGGPGGFGGGGGGERGWPDARAALRICEESDLGDWVLAAAYEAEARASAVAGDSDAAREWLPRGGGPAPGDE